MSDRPGDDAAARFIGVNWALMGALTVIISLTPYSVDAFLPSFPGAGDALGASASQMQLTLTGFLLGIAAGQLVFGPLSDRLGRRGPLLVGSAVCAAAAIVCALAPTLEVLLVARFVQGLAGSAGAVLSKAIIRDRTTGKDTVHFLAMTAVGSGVLNVFAPMIGGVLLQNFGWRGPLWFIAAVAVAMFVLIAALVPETHAPHLRDPRGGWLGMPSIVRHLRNPAFSVYVVIQSCSYGTLMAYVAASPFVYQNILGFDAAAYGLLFSINGTLAVACNFVANRFLRHLGPRTLVVSGLGLSLVGTAAVTASLMLGAPPFVVAAAITLSMAPLGLNGPNLVGLALNQVTKATGSAAATIGFVQFCTGAIISPIVGLGGDATAVPMLVAMAALAVTGILVLLVAARPRGFTLAARLGGG